MATVVAALEPLPLPSTEAPKLDTPSVEQDLYELGLSKADVISCVRLPSGARYTVLKPGPMHEPEKWPALRKYGQGTSKSRRDREQRQARQNASGDR